MATKFARLPKCAVTFQRENLTTDEEAKKLFCMDKVARAHCDGSACMVWRWAVEYVEGPNGEAQRKNPKRGYCGIPPCAPEIIPVPE